MALLSEETVLAGVEVLPLQCAINVRWEYRILKDGQVISAENQRRAYSEFDRAQFLTDVPDGIVYADAAGLKEVPSE